MKIIRAEDKQRQRAQDTIHKIAASLTHKNPDLYLAELINDKTRWWLSQFITCDPEMNALKERVIDLAPRNEPVLITGPSGTGKELIARALHGMRAQDDFFALNCAGMPEGLIESELFGHEHGSFTGANKSYPGILRAADSGTVFLDEIGEAPISLQAKLLRALQPNHKGQYVIRPVGSTMYHPINCRIIAATKQDLFAQVKAGQFREDLYGRLMAFELQTTPLSARPTDTILILRHLGIEEDIDTTDLTSNYWQQRIELFNVRALQAYAKRKLV